MFIPNLLEGLANLGGHGVLSSSQVFLALRWGRPGSLVRELTPQSVQRDLSWAHCLDQWRIAEFIIPARYPTSLLLHGMLFRLTCGCLANGGSDAVLLAKLRIAPGESDPTLYP
jgi:hypothetical protein